MYNNEPQVGDPTPSGDVHVYLDNLRVEHEELWKEIQELAVQLSPVRMQRNDDNNDPGHPEEVLSPLADSIRSEIKKIERCRIMIRQLQKELQV